MLLRISPRPDLLYRLEAAGVDDKKLLPCVHQSRPEPADQASQEQNGKREFELSVSSQKGSFAEFNAAVIVFFFLRRLGLRLSFYLDLTKVVCFPLVQFPKHRRGSDLLRKIFC